MNLAEFLRIIFGSFRPTKKEILAYEDKQSAMNYLRSLAKKAIKWLTLFSLLSGGAALLVHEFPLLSLVFLTVGLWAILCNLTFCEEFVDTNFKLGHLRGETTKYAVYFALFFAYGFTLLAAFITQFGKFVIYGL